MAFPWALAALVPQVAGLIMGQDSNRRAQNSQDEALDAQRALAEKQAKAYEERLKLYKKLVGLGAYDEAKSILNYEGNAAASQRQALGNQSAAAATLGYKPGDSAPIQGLRDTSAGFARQAANDKFAIAQSLRQQQQNDLRATDPGSLSAPGQQFGQLSQTYAGQQQSLAPYIQSILTNPMMKPRTATATPTVASSVSSVPVGIQDPNMGQVDDGMGGVTRSSGIRPMPKKADRKRSNKLTY